MGHPWFSLLFVATCLSPLTFARVVRTSYGGSAMRNRRQNNDQYSRFCPMVICPSVPDNCRMIEFFVMEMGLTTDSGQTVTVECQSCDYCVDLPPAFGDASRTRERRHANHHRRRDCTTVVCPEVPSDCADIRMTDVLLGNTKCTRCPACYDGTVFNRST